MCSSSRSRSTCKPETKSGKHFFRPQGQESQWLKMSPPAGNWPQRVSGVLPPAWPGDAEGGGPSAPAPSAVETELSDVAKSRTSNSSPLAIGGKRSLGEQCFPQATPHTTHTTAVLHSAKDSWKGKEKGSYCLQKDHYLLSMLVR